MTHPDAGTAQGWRAPAAVLPAVLVLPSLLWSWLPEASCRLPGSGTGLALRMIRC